jgi:hypothetical protein
MLHSIRPFCFGVDQRSVSRAGSLNLSLEIWGPLSERAEGIFQVVALWQDKTMASRRELRRGINENKAGQQAAQKYNVDRPAGDIQCTSLQSY